MSNKITFFDVETATSSNDTMCQLGLVHVDCDGNVFSEEFLVNPVELSFSAHAIKVHGITIDMVKDQLNFVQVWDKVKHYFEDATVVGHNVSFDASVLGKSLAMHNIDIPNVDFICTKVLSKDFITLDKYSLEDVCEYLDVEYDSNKAHSALYDAKRCMEAFYKLDVNDIEGYKLGNLLDNYVDYKKEITIEEIDKYFQEVVGIFKGIAVDGIINKQEIMHFNNWRGKVSKFRYFDNIVADILDIIEDGVITEVELQDIRKYSNQKRHIVQLRSLIESIACDKAVNKQEIELLQNELKFYKNLDEVKQFGNLIERILFDSIITDEEHSELLEFINLFYQPKTMVNEIEYINKSFYISGDEKRALTPLIEAKGGVVKKTNTKKDKVDYLILGTSDRFKEGNYGINYTKAINWGIPVVMLSDLDILNYDN